MFGLIKPAHVQMRAVLPQPISVDFDEVLSSFEHLVPRHWSKGANHRAIAIVMGQWILSKADAGAFRLPQVATAKVEHLVALAEQFNDSDHHGDGSMSTAFARDVIRAMREGGIIPV